MDISYLKTDDSVLLFFFRSLVGTLKSPAPAPFFPSLSFPRFSSPAMYRSMKSLALLGLLAPAYAHPASGHKSGVARRSIDVEAFRLPQVGSYTNATEAETSPPIVLLKRESYVETATELVKKVAPNAEFRVVGDHYVGSNGIGHVNFKQTAHGLDIDNADFNANVCFPIQLSHRDN